MKYGTMCFWDIEPSDWFKKYFHGISGFDDVFKSIDEMRNRMDREFEEGFKQFESGVNKEDIKINAYDSMLEITTTDAEGIARRYHERIELPEEADLTTARSKYNNGILEITFSKKDKSKPKGKEIKIE